MAIVTMQKTPVNQLDIVYIMYICTNILNKICVKRVPLISGRLLANPSELWYNLIELYSMAYCAGEKRQTLFCKLGGITK